MAMWDNCAICGRAIPIGEPCYGVKNWRGDPIGGDTICRDCLVLENVPTLTPPEIVCCQDCVHHEDGYARWCNKWEHTCPDDSEFFCKYGRKKNENTTD